MNETKFKVGDRVLCTDNGNYGNVTFVDTSQVGEYDGEIWYEVSFDNGEETWLTAEQLELTSVDKKTAFLTELKALLEKYDAKINVCVRDWDEVYMEFILGDSKNEVYIDYSKPYVYLTPENIFDYDE